MPNKVDLFNFYLEAEKQKAQSKMYGHRNRNAIKDYWYERGRYEAFCENIQTLALLYNSENENSGEKDGK